MRSVSCMCENSIRRVVMSVFLDDYSWWKKKEDANESLTMKTLMIRTIVIWKIRDAISILCKLISKLKPMIVCNHNYVTSHLKSKVEYSNKNFFFSPLQSLLGVKNLKKNKCDSYCWLRFLINSISIYNTRNRKARNTFI